MLSGQSREPITTASARRRIRSGTGSESVQVFVLTEMDATMITVGGREARTSTGYDAQCHRGERSRNIIREELAEAGSGRGGSRQQQPDRPQHP